jgi:hypothetical protein
MKRLTPAVLLLMTTGCVFAVRPMDSIPPGDRVVLQLNDRGISEMAPKLGSGVYLVGGRLRQVDSTRLVLSMGGTRSTYDVFPYYGYNNGSTYSLLPTEWNGETVSIPKVDVAVARQQRISTPLAVAIGAGVVATGVSTGLIIANWHHRLPPLPKLQSPPTSNGPFVHRVGPNAGYNPANGP